MGQKRVIQDGVQDGRRTLIRTMIDRTAKIEAAHLRATVSLGIDTLIANVLVNYNVDIA